MPAGSFLTSSGTAANASALGGIGAGGFVQGSAHATLGVADAPIANSPSVCGESTEVTRETVATIPGFGTITAYCRAYNAGTPICAYSFENTSGMTLTGQAQETVGGEGIKLSEPEHLSFANVVNGHSLEGSSNAPEQYSVWQVGAAAGEITMTALVSDSHVESGATTCHVQAQVLTTG